MHFYGLWPVIFLFFCENINAFDLGPIPMTKWTDPKDLGTWSGGPTWHAETIFSLPDGEVMNWMDLLNIAKGHYEWLQPKPQEQKGTVLVAALWDPISKTVFASTVPVGPRRAFMALASHNDEAAPLWYAQMKSIIKPYSSFAHDNYFHAEDGAYFNYETSRAVEGNLAGQYPLGTMIAVYGKMPGEDPNLANLCTRGRRPNCQEIAKALGVQINSNPYVPARGTTTSTAPVTSTSSAPVTTSSSADDDSGDEYGTITVDEWNAADAVVCSTSKTAKRDVMAIRALRPARREVNSACTLLSFPTAVSASTVKVTLASSDFTGSATAMTSSTNKLSSLPTTTLGLFYDGPLGAPEFQTTIEDGSKVTWSYSYFIAGDASSEELAYDAVSVTNPKEVSGSRTAIIYKTSVSGKETTVVAFETTIPPSPPAIATASLATPTSYPCYNYVDSEGSGKDFCMCSNGATLPVVPATGANTGKAYMPCPYTVEPSISTPTPSPAHTGGGNNMYPYLTTLIGGGETFVEECQYLSTINIAGFQEVYCAGKIVTLSAPPSVPSVSVKVGQNQVLVGSLSSSVLYTSISNALESLCPSPTLGKPLVVPSGTQKIGGIVWVDSGTEELQKDGELVISIDSGNYTDPAIRSAMIKAAAMSFMKSAGGSNCWNQSYVEFDYHGSNLEREQPLCNAANFVGVDYFGSVPFGAASDHTQWLYPHIGFTVDAGSFDCAEFIEDLDALLVAIAPEFAIADTELGAAIVAICDEVTD